ncbi:MAG: hypothetical protein V1763_00195 [Parcubacteria group bacterium]
MLKSSIFKEYDIRGKYPSEFNAATAFKIGRALAESAKGGKRVKGEKIGTRIAVGRDRRSSSVLLARQVIKGITAQGVDVIDLGQVSTPTFYFSVANYGYDGGAMVTASHNQTDYNGLKLVRAGAVEMNYKNGLPEIEELVRKNKFVVSRKRGGLKKKNSAVFDEIKFAREFVGRKNIKPLKIVVDAGNGIGGLAFEELFKQLPCELIKLNFGKVRVVGNAYMRSALSEMIKTNNADLGVSLDPDADRILFTDNNGDPIQPALMQALLSKIFLRNHVGAKVCYDIRPGKIKIETIKDAGGEPVMTPVGSSLIKELMLKNGAIFGSEASGHYFIESVARDERDRKEFERISCAI